LVALLLENVIEMPEKLDLDPELVSGYGFHLEGDGKWDVQQIPQYVVDNAKFSGYLTIQGYACSVFEMPDGDQWAQKSSGIPAPKGDEGAVEKLASLKKIAHRIAHSKYSRVQLEPNMIRAVQSMVEEMEEAEEALSKAVQYGRILEIEPSFEWIVDQIQTVLKDFKDFRKSANESMEYITQQELD
jgi:hypothetical protein